MKKVRIAVYFRSCLLKPLVDSIGLLFDTVQMTTCHIPRDGIWKGVACMQARLSRPNPLAASPLAGYQQPPLTSKIFWQSI